MRVVSTLLLSAVLFVALQPTVIAQAVARDSAGTVYEAAVNALIADGIVRGYPDGSIRPFDYISRAEALKVIMRSQNAAAAQADLIAKMMPPIPLFKDVDQKAWYAPYVEAGFRLGVVKGNPDGTFRPGDPVTTEQAIALVMRVNQESGNGIPFQSSQFFENQPNQWYTSYANAAIQKNLIMHDLILRPMMPITRGQFFDIVYREREVNHRNLAAFPEPAGGTITTGPVTPRARPTPQTVFAQYASKKAFAIAMPTLGIYDLTITHPDDPFSSKGILAPLEKGVGHLFGYPGEGSKIMLYGHSSGYPWDISEFTKIFRKINELTVGDRAYVTYNGKVFVYEVTKHETVNVDDATPFQPNADGEELILYTCWPPDTVDQRYLVHLKPVDIVASR